MHSNNQGIFGTTAHCSFGDGNSTRMEDEDTPPVASLWDVGVSPQRYISEPEKATAPSGRVCLLTFMFHPTHFGFIDLWTESVRHSGASRLATATFEK